VRFIPERIAAEAAASRCKREIGAVGMIAKLAHEFAAVNRVYRFAEEAYHARLVVLIGKSSKQQQQLM
jgi:hypothetical protein